MSAKMLSALCGALGLLAGCGTAVTDALTQDELTRTGFVEVPEINKNGLINIGLENDIVTRAYRASPGNFGGYAFQTGGIDGEGLFAVAGLFPGTSVTRPPSGTASYFGEYNLIAIDNIAIRNGEINGDRTLHTGDLVLLADFDNNAIFSAPGSDLAVNGAIDVTGINGTVRFNGVTGSLDGLVGGNQAIGAFHGEGNVGPGTDDDYMYAGGFIADR